MGSFLLRFIFGRFRKQTVLIFLFVEVLCIILCKVCIYNFIKEKVHSAFTFVRQVHSLGIRPVTLACKESMMEKRILLMHHILFCRLSTFLISGLELILYKVNLFSAYLFNLSSVVRLIISPASAPQSTFAKRTACIRPAPVKTATRRWWTSRMECSDVRNVTKNSLTSNIASCSR